MSESDSDIPPEVLLRAMASAKWVPEREDETESKEEDSDDRDREG